MRELAQKEYNSFIKGLYGLGRAHDTKMIINEKCLGPEIQNGLEKIEDVLSRLLFKQFGHVSQEEPTLA